MNSIRHRWRRRAKAPQSQTSRYTSDASEKRGRRSRPSPPHPNTSTTPRRASRGPTKVDYVFRWRFTSFTSKGPRHQGAVWRFNIIYKEQGTISIIELLAHKQNPLQSKQVFWTSCGFSASAPARALLSFIFKNPPPSPHDQPRSRGPRTRATACDARRTKCERAHWPRQTKAKAHSARAHTRDRREALAPPPGLK